MFSPLVIPAIIPPKYGISQIAQTATL